MYWLHNPVGLPLKDKSVFWQEMNIHTDLASSILIHPIFSEYTSNSYILSQRSVSGLDVWLSSWLKVKRWLTELQGWIRPEMKHCRRGCWLAGLLFVTPDLNQGWGWEGNSISSLLPPNQGAEGQASKGMMPPPLWIILQVQCWNRVPTILRRKI